MLEQVGYAWLVMSLVGLGMLAIEEIYFWIRKAIIDWKNR